MSLWGNTDTAAVTGTIGIPNGSATVTGAGTAFTTELMQGSCIVIATVKYKILKVVSNTSLTLTSNYEGTTIASGATITKQTLPKYLNVADMRRTVFVSSEEAIRKTNKDKGITGAGWWLVTSFTDGDGKSRFKSELLIAMTTLDATSGDAADDTIVADAEVTVTIATQPANQTTSTGGATFSITASVSSGSLTYQWQKKLAAIGSRWANVAGATNTTIALTGQASGTNGDQYRVVLTSTSGAAPVTSNAATLTFGT